MNTKFPWIAILAASALAIGCGESDDDKDDEDGGSSDGGAGDGGGGGDGGGDGGSSDGGSGDGGSSGIPNDYTSYNGWEAWDLGLTMTSAGDRNCQLVWRFENSNPVNPMDGSCENCVFMFQDVEYITDTEVSWDDGTCEYYGLTGDFVGTYGYSDDFDGYGPSWVYNYYGYYYWWGTGDFDGSQFQYDYGYKDYAYSYNGNTYYYTFYQYGLVDVL